MKTDYILAVLPLIPSLYLILNIADWNVKYPILISLGIAIISYFCTISLIPVIAEYTLKRRLCGKDLGKKGTPRESIDVPEALGIVCGVVFLVSTIASQFVFAIDMYQLVIFNSALFSVCFMIFLGFTDDTLDLKWRYKLILPTVASLPLLSAYSGSTAVYIPLPFQKWLLSDGQLTSLGSIINMFATVDTEAHGRIVELGFLFLIFMGLLAVFCTNAINIYAGINGLECGQAYIIGCSILFFKVYELWMENVNDHQYFALYLIIPFIGTSLGLLKYNWFPAQVFVGDTFCYFAGMTFAVVGIHGHFSKTLLLLFIPQVFNFLYSIPQLFKIMDCPRHRLPRIDPVTGLMHPSTFPCKKEQWRWLKLHPDDTECPNCTLICLVLQKFGPMRERTLSIVLLSIQILCSMFVFFLRYVLFEDK